MTSESFLKSNKFSFGNENLYLKTISTVEDSKQEILDLNSSEILISKLRKLEEIYKEKAEIYEKRIEELKKNNKSLSDEKSEIVKRNEELLIDINLKENKYNEMLRKSIQDQEESLRNQYELKLSNIIQLNEEYNKELHTLRKNFDNSLNDLNYENNLLKQQNKQKDYDLDQMTEKYNSLLNIHNTMLQFDMSKNVQNLKILTYKEQNS